MMSSVSTNIGMRLRHPLGGGAERKSIPCFSNRSHNSLIVLSPKPEVGVWKETVLSVFSSSDLGAISWRSTSPVISWIPMTSLSNLE